MDSEVIKGIMVYVSWEWKVLLGRASASNLCGKMVVSSRELLGAGDLPNLA